MEIKDDNAHTTR